MACNDGSYGWGKRVTVRTRRKPCFFNYFPFHLLIPKAGLSNAKKLSPRAEHDCFRAPGTFIVLTRP